MKRMIGILSLMMLCNVCAVCAQTAQDIDHKLGLVIGTSAIQGISLSLYDLNKQEIAGSSPITPAQFLAFYQRGVSSHVAVRFLSGYCWGQHADNTQFDYDKIQLEGDIQSSETQFNITGFPVELSVIFHNNIGESGNVGWHCGIGAGYYALNFEAKGTINVKDIAATRHVKTEYRNNPYTLSGWTQFFVFGFQLHLSDQLGAMCELSKIGFSGLYLEQDAIKDVIVDGDVERQLHYGSTKEQYLPKTGLNDVAVSVGMFWKM